MSKPELIAADDHLASCSECREMLANREDLRAKIDSLRADLDKSLDEEHVDYAQLEAYVDQTLSATEREALDSHLKSCTSCAKEWRDLRALKKELEAQEILGPVGAAVSAKELLALQGFRSQVEAREILGSGSAEVSAGSAQPRARKMLSFGSPSAWRTGSRWALAACALIALAIGLLSVWVWQRRPNTVVHKPETMPAPIPQPSKPPEVGHRPEAVPGPRLQPSEPPVTVRKAAPTPAPRVSSTPSATALASFSYLPVELQAIVMTAIKDQHLRIAHDLPLLVSSLSFRVLRRGPSQSSPFLLSPVETVAYSTTPVFEWRAVPGADGYRVRVSDLRQKPVESSPAMTGTSWKSTVALKRGKAYVWWVTIIRDAAEVEESPLDVNQAHFTVLNKSQSRQLENLARDHPEEHFARGVLLAHAGVLEEAVQEFRAVPPSDPNHSLATKFERDAQEMIAGWQKGSAE